MSNLSTATKLVLATGALVGLLGWLLIVELGLNAGVVHHGVSVGEYDVGGLTFNELEETLEERGARLRAAEVCFSRDDTFLCVDPANIGWRPEPGATAEQAFNVGRTDSWFGALSARADAWVDGVNVQWAGGPKAAKVTKLLDEWEALLAARGMTLEKDQIRYKIRRAIVIYPRRTFRIPIE